MLNGKLEEERYMKQPKGLGWFYGISTIVGYLKLNPVNTYQIYMILNTCQKLDSSMYCYVSLTIHLNISYLLMTEQFYFKQFNISYFLR